MSIIKRATREASVFVCSKGFLADNRLTWEAKGLLCFLLSREGMETSIDDMRRHGTAGRYKITAALDLLEKHGYFQKVSTRDENGCFTGMTYMVCAEGGQSHAN